MEGWMKRWKELEKKSLERGNKGGRRRRERKGREKKGVKER